MSKPTPSSETQGHIREIEAAENVGVRLNSRVVDGGGEGRLEHLTIEDSASGTTETVGAAALFVLIGARPHTGWLADEVVRDEGGYVLTGQDLTQDGRPLPAWTAERPLLETSMRGGFATGDMRRGSVKRVASAVGEGSIAIQMVHRYMSLSPDPSGGAG